MALPATANFTGSDGTALPTADANFTTISGSNNLVINTNGVCPSGNPSGAYWDADSFDANQYAQISIAAITGTATNWIGPAVRVDSAGFNLYSFQFGKSATLRRRLVRVDGGTVTVLLSDNTAPSVSDVFRIEADGSDILGYINGALWNSTTDATYGGADPAGIYANGTLTTNRGDDWEAGNLSVPGGLVIRKGQRAMRGLIVR